MSPLELWASAIFKQAECVVFGQKLRPLSIAHLLCLRALESTAICGDDEVTESAVAVVVCSRTYAEIMRDLFANPANSEKHIRRIAKRILRYNISSECQSLQDYLHAGSVCPEHWEPVDKKVSTVRAPWELHVVRVLCSTYHMTFDQAMDAPASFGRALYDVQAEADGSDSLKSDEEYAAEKKLMEAT